MTENNHNNFIKIIIILVITLLALVAIAYLLLSSTNDNNRGPEIVIPVNNQEINKDSETPMEDINDSDNENVETDINTSNTNTENNTVALPDFADIDNYEFNTAKIYASTPVNCKFVNNEYQDLLNELNVEQTGYLTYVYNGFWLQAIENKRNWNQADLLKITKENDCASSIFYGTIENGKYLIFGRCSGTSSLGYNKNDYSTLVGNCSTAANELYEYFGSAMVGSYLIEKTW